MVIDRYLFVDHSVPATCLNLAAAKFNAADSRVQPNLAYHRPLMVCGTCDASMIDGTDETS
jgi:hypothetical protein